MNLLKSLFDDNFFGDFFYDVNEFPKMDVIKNENNFIIVVALPGVAPENIKVEVVNAINGEVLKISGKMDEENINSKYYTKELRRSQFSREINLPDELEGDPEASLKNGILKLSWELIKKKSLTETKIIKIKTEEPDEITKIKEKYWQNAEKI